MELEMCLITSVIRGDGLVLQLAYGLGGSGGKTY